jgi:hypothetical protein
LHLLADRSTATSSTSAFRTLELLIGGQKDFSTGWSNITSAADIASFAKNIKNWVDQFGLGEPLLLCCWTVYHSHHRLLSLSLCLILSVSLSADGVDVDFEELDSVPATAPTYNTLQAQRIAVLQQLRAVMPRPRYLLSMACWSIGACDPTMCPKWANNGNIGMELPVYANTQVRDSIDAFNVMSYFTGTACVLAHRLLTLACARQVMKATRAPRLPTVCSPW